MTANRELKEMQAQQVRAISKERLPTPRLNFKTHKRKDSLRLMSYKF